MCRGVYLFIFVYGGLNWHHMFSSVILHLIHRDKDFPLNLEIICMDCVASWLALGNSVSAFPELEIQTECHVYLALTRVSFSPHTYGPSSVPAEPNLSSTKCMFFISVCIFVCICGESHTCGDLRTILCHLLELHTPPVIQSHSLALNLLSTLSWLASKLQESL